MIPLVTASEVGKAQSELTLFLKKRVKLWSVEILVCGIDYENWIGKSSHRR